MRNLRARAGAASDVSLHRVVEFDPAGATIRAPFRVVDTSRQLPPAGLTLPKSAVLNELMFHPRPELLAQASDDPEAAAELTRHAALRRDPARRRGLPTIVFTVLDDLNLDTRSVSNLADAAYTLGDIIALPSLLKPKEVMADPKQRARFMDLQRKFLDVLEKLNHKAVAACFPNGGIEFCQEIVKWAAGRGIRLFAYDFDAYGATSQEVPVRAILRTLKEQEILEESVTYAWNLRRMSAGGMPKGSGVQRATDVLAWGMGFDVIGESRRQRFLSKKQLGRVELDPRPRFFNPGGYSYEHLPKSAAITAGRKAGATSVEVENRRWVQAVQHMADYASLAGEAEALREALREKRMAKHLASKTHLSPEASHAMQASREDLRVRQRALDYF